MNLNRFHKQSGATLMEVLVAMTISLVVTASMLALMSNSLGTTARIVNMTKLSDDLRVAMQMVTRDLRRSSYNADAMYCYGNEDCMVDGTLAATGEIQLTDADADSYFDGLTFRTDRFSNNYATETGGIDNGAGGFRLASVNGVGVIQMWTGGALANLDPNATDNWVDITDPSSMNITEFVLDDSLSYSQVVLDDIYGNRITQEVRKIRVSMIGELVVDPSITRHVEDIITVRNDVLTKDGAIL
jgi:Tfp pilus assembly protein PilV